jgi:hypothetical protein
MMSTYVYNARRQQPDEENLLVPESKEDGDIDGTEGLSYEDKVLWSCLTVAAFMLFLIL